LAEPARGPQPETAKHYRLIINGKVIGEEEKTKDRIFFKEALSLVIKTLRLCVARDFFTCSCVG
jgi:hypothetical protein